MHGEFRTQHKRQSSHTSLISHSISFFIAVLFDVSAVSVARWETHNLWQSGIRNASCETIGKCPDRRTRQTSHTCQNPSSTTGLKIQLTPSTSIRSLRQVSLKLDSLSRHQTILTLVESHASHFSKERWRKSS